jgi:Kelch motif
MKNLKTILIITSFVTIIMSCSKSDDATTPIVEPAAPELKLSKTERTVASPIRNLSSTYFWVVKDPKKDAFYIHNADNDPDTSLRGMMLYDVTTDTFTNKTKSTNVVAAGQTSQLVAVPGGNSYELFYVANQFNIYNPTTDTWRVLPTTAYPSTISDYQSGAGSCNNANTARVFYIGGSGDSKTVKYTNNNGNWGNAADYPFTLSSSGPECIETFGAGTFYCLGGYDTSGTRSKKFFKFEVDGNTWSELPEAPVNVDQDNILHKMVLYQGHIVYIGTDSKLHIFNIETNKWQTSTVDISGALDHFHLAVSSDQQKIFLLYRKANNSLGIQEYKKI